MTATAGYIRVPPTNDGGPLMAYRLNMITDYANELQLPEPPVLFTDVARDSDDLPGLLKLRKAVFREEITVIIVCTVAELRPAASQLEKLFKQREVIAHALERSTENKVLPPEFWWGLASPAGTDQNIPEGIS